MRQGYLLMLRGIIVALFVRLREILLYITCLGVVFSLSAISESIMKDTAAAAAYFFFSLECE